MQECDRAAVRTLRIPGSLLMENAGRGVVDSIERNFGPVDGKSFLIVCGKGNNGGDGFVAARHLHLRSAAVSVLTCSGAKNYKNDARMNYEIFRSFAVRSPGTCRLKAYTSPKSLTSLPKYDCIIDAIFGTGFSGEVREPYRSIIQWINRQPGIKVAIDSPSGLDTDTGKAGGAGVRADLTVTMCVRKTGLVVGDARAFTGKTEIADIGFPPGILNRKVTTHIIHPQDVRRALPLRPFNVHKHNVGKIFVVAGSRGLTGAAAMASMAAMRGGAGAVILGTPESVYPILAKKLTEIMVTPLWETSGGSLSVTALDQMHQHIDWADVVVLGPGLSVHPETVELVRQMVRTVSKPLLVDADGLNAFEHAAQVFRKHRSKNLIITPHTGELSRIISIPSAEIEADRIALSRQYSRQLNVILVLKGAPTVTALPGGDIFVNSTGNAGMATAGSGDVLTGLISGLWGQGMGSGEAAYSGVYLHGLSGDMVQKEIGEKSLMAMDMLTHIPEAFRFVRQSG